MCGLWGKIKIRYFTCKYTQLLFFLQIKDDPSKFYEIVCYKKPFICVAVQSERDLILIKGVGGWIQYNFGLAIVHGDKIQTNSYNKLIFKKISCFFSLFFLFFFSLLLMYFNIPKSQDRHHSSMLNKKPSNSSLDSTTAIMTDDRISEIIHNLDDHWGSPPILTPNTLSHILNHQWTSDEVKEDDIKKVKFT